MHCRSNACRALTVNKIRSGLIYRAMGKLYTSLHCVRGCSLTALGARSAGFPLDFFPVLFAVPRVVGWLAHWRQMMLQEGGVKIWRPRQVRVDVMA